MGEAPGERPELHDRDEACQVEHLPLQVLAVADAAQIEQLGACTHPIVFGVQDSVTAFQPLAHSRHGSLCIKHEICKEKAFLVAHSRHVSVRH